MRVTSDRVSADSLRVYYVTGERMASWKVSSQSQWTFRKVIYYWPLLIFHYLIFPLKSQLR